MSTRGYGDAGRPSPAGRPAAAARSRSTSVRNLPSRPGRGNLDRSGVGERQPDGASLPRPAAIIQTSRAARIEGSVSDSRIGGGLGRAANSHDRPFVRRARACRGRAMRRAHRGRSQRAGRRRTVLGHGLRGGWPWRNWAAYLGGRGLRIVAVRPIRAWHRTHTRWIRIDVVEQRAACAGLVALRIARGQEPLVTPPDVQMPPIHRVTGRCHGKLDEHRGADAAPGQHQGGAALCGLRIHEPGDQPRRHRLGQ